MRAPLSLCSVNYAMCSHIHTHARTCPHTHTHTYTHTHIHTHTRAHTPTHTRTHTHIHPHTRTYTHTHTHTHAHTPTHTHIHPHTHAHTHTQGWLGFAHIYRRHCNVLDHETMGYGSQLCYRLYCDRHVQPIRAIRGKSPVRRSGDRFDKSDPKPLQVSCNVCVGVPT